MKAAIQKNKLTGAINESLISQNNFVCLLSMIKGYIKIEEKNCLTTNVQKITQLNSVKLNNLLKEGIQKDLILKNFNLEDEYLSYLSQLKDKDICVNFIKYKAYFLERPKSNLNLWLLENDTTQKKIFLFTTNAVLPILLPNIIKEIEKS